MIIREATSCDLESVMTVERLAFGTDIEPELVRKLLNDSSAKPVVSLLAIEDGHAVGHILFTRAHLTECSFTPITYILAPLAVIPQAQNKGIGGKLIMKGLNFLSNLDVSLVFVLGHPIYYVKYGFKPAGYLGFDAPFPIPENNANAWMVQALKSGVIGKIHGKIKCAGTLNKPEYWRE